MSPKNLLLPVLATFALLPAAAFSAVPRVEKSVVVCPWTFTNGTDTARETALKTVGEISSKNGYTAIDQDKATSSFHEMGDPKSPSKSQLRSFGNKVGADYVVYGSTDWHTRSIWVGAGPKTISTATVSVNVLSCATGKVVYSKKNVSARSDEKENAVKVAAAVLITPLVTAVSGGPQTPQEQRAVQIALARAFENWNKQIGK